MGFSRSGVFSSLSKGRLLRFGRKNRIAEVMLFLGAEGKVLYFWSFQDEGIWIRVQKFILSMLVLTCTYVEPHLKSHVGVEACPLQAEKRYLSG